MRNSKKNTTMNQLDQYNQSKVNKIQKYYKYLILFPDFNFEIMKLLLISVMGLINLLLYWSENSEKGVILTNLNILGIAICSLTQISTLFVQFFFLKKIFLD